MDENLPGYLLKALDADEQRAVEAYLSEHAEAQQHLDQLRRRLDLLSLDAVDPDPPPGLWIRTLAAIAEHRCRPLPLAPSPSRAQHGSVTGRFWWRRIDLAVAAVLLLLVGGMVLTWLSRTWESYRIGICKNNLHQFHTALVAYSDIHQDCFPSVEAKPPRNHAGYYLPILRDAGVLPSDDSLACPANGRRPPAVLPPDLEALYHSRREEFRETIRRVGGSYAYSLGYSVNGKRDHHGLTRRMEDELPIMADRPPFTSAANFFTANSPNHGGRGQNILFIGGHVRFCTSRFAGLNNDDIFLNVDHRVEAGRGPRDTVLGSSEASPYPEDDE